VFSEKYILTIGGSNIDITGITRGAFAAHDSNPGAIRLSAGGVGRNIAENLARLNVPVKLVTAIGNDEFGRILLERCRSYGIDMSRALISDNSATSTYAAIMDENKDLAAAVSDMKIMDELTPGFLEGLLPVIDGAAVVIADNNLCPESLDLIKKHCRDKLLFDAVSGNKLKTSIKSIKDINTIKVNALEAEILSGITIKSQKNAEKAAAAICGLGFKNVFITLGAEGAILGTADECWFTRPPKTPVVNTTGAGDAFMAGAAFGIFSGMHGEDLLKTGSACAAIAAASANTVSDRLSLKIMNKILEGDYSDLFPVS
jgi:pseudouridine kinase